MNENEVKGSFLFLFFEGGEEGVALEDKEWFGRVKVPGQVSLNKWVFRLHEYHEDLGQE